jgi:hypothetical protein
MNGKLSYYERGVVRAMMQIKELLEAEPNIKLLHFSEEHGEITAEYIKPKKAFLVISVITVFSFRTVIDLIITIKTLLLPMDGGFSKKAVLGLYKKLDKNLEFVGVGLSEE